MVMTFCVSLGEGVSSMAAGLLCNGGPDRFERPSSQSLGITHALCNEAKYSNRRDEKYQVVELSMYLADVSKFWW